MNKFESRQSRKELLYKEFRKRPKGATINEIINDLFSEAMDIYGKHVLSVLGWRYFVHLNKFPAVMEKDGFLQWTGEYKIGETGHKEKIWKVL